MPVFAGETVHNIYFSPSWQWVSTEHQQFSVLPIGYSRHCMDHWAQNGNNDRLYRQKYKIHIEKHRFQNNRYHMLQSMQRDNTGCRISNFDNILFSDCKNKSIIWIYRWTHWATCWQPAQLRQVVRFPSNFTWIDSLGMLKARNSKWGYVRFRPGPIP